MRRRRPVQPQVEDKSLGVFSFLTLLSLLCFLTLVILQVIELQHYGNPESVWPEVWMENWRWFFKKM